MDEAARRSKSGQFIAINSVPRPVFAAIGGRCFDSIFDRVGKADTDLLFAPIEFFDGKDARLRIGSLVSG